MEKGSQNHLRRELFGVQSSHHSIIQLVSLPFHELAFLGAASIPCNKAFTDSYEAGPPAQQSSGDS